MCVATKSMGGLLTLEDKGPSGSETSTPPCNKERREHLEEAEGRGTYRDLHGGCGRWPAQKKDHVVSKKLTCLFFN